MCIDFFQLITKLNLILIHSQFFFISFKFYLSCSCFQFDSNQDNFKLFHLNSILIYSNGPCFNFKFLNSSSFKSIKLKFNNQECVDTSKSWITSFDYLIKKNEIILIWIDSEQDEIKTGFLDLDNSSLTNVSKLNILKNDFGHFGRTLIIDQSNFVLYLSLPKLNQIDSIDLKTLKRNTIVENIEDLGQIVIDSKQRLIWIEKSYCIWRLEKNKHTTKLYCKKDKSISTIFFNIKSDSIFWLTNTGKIESLNLKTGKHHIVLDNLLQNDKYSETFFYTFKMMYFNDRLIFVSSDIKHQLIRITSLQTTSKLVFRSNESLVLLVDFPNVYDFVLININYKNVSTKFSLSNNQDEQFNSSMFNILNPFQKNNSSLFWIIYISIIIISIPIFLIFFGLIIAKKRRHQLLVNSSEDSMENIAKH